MGNKMQQTMNLNNIEKGGVVSDLEQTNCQYVTFSLGEELFGLEVKRTREILSLTPVTKVPQTPAYLLGVINLRGQVVPVIDMRLKLSLPVQDNSEDTCILVVEVLVDGETIIVGALADAVREVLEIRSDQVEPAPRLGTRLNTDFIKGMGKVGEEFLILLDINRVFSSNDLVMLQDKSDESKTSQTEGE